MSGGPGQLRRLLSRIAVLFQPGRAESELAREIDAHLRLLEDQHVENGMSRDEARYAAKRAFGGVEQAKELQRDERSFRWLAGWPMDLKLGARMLVRSPGLTVVAVVALAIAIGAGAAYREFTRDWTHPTLDVPGTEGLMGVQVWDMDRRKPEWQALADFAVWRHHATTIDNLGAAVGFVRAVVTEDGSTDVARGAEISAAAFEVLPTPPIIGRTLRAQDERPESPPVAVIGHELWQQRFSGDPDVLARSVRIGAVTHAIVGVMPTGFGFPINQNLWIPLKVEPGGLTRGTGPGVITMFGRLADGVRAGGGAGGADETHGGNAGRGPARRAPGRRPAVSRLAVGGRSRRPGDARHPRHQRHLHPAARHLRRKRRHARVRAHGDA
jgi:hypothetical protein